MTHRINPKLDERKQQIIIGTILGGSSIIKPKRGRNCYLSMRSRDIEWLRYKATELESLASQDPITIEKTNRWHSVCYPLFNEYRGKFYNTKGDRDLQVEYLSGMWDVALAVWFGDCGKFKNGKVTFNTHIWKEKGSKIIVKYFSYLDYEAEVIQERKNYRVRLDEKSSADFMKIVEPKLPYFFVNRKTNQMNTPNPPR
ncbi:MAG: hypothetical protein ACW99G_00300 [Candidatus Thorarchaeota archaeon]|jgi:hypothetical protein